MICSPVIHIANGPPPSGPFWACLSHLAHGDPVDHAAAEPFADSDHGLDGFAGSVTGLARPDGLPWVRTRRYRMSPDHLGIPLGGSSRFRAAMRKGALTAP